MYHAPLNTHTTRPQLQVPSGACDTHMHIYGPPEQFPFVAGTTAMTPPPASVADYKAMAERLGLERVVVVQPAGYGTDNRCTLDALAQFGNAARGVATVDPYVTEADLERMSRAGMRGARFHMLPGGALSWQALEPIAAKVAPLGWHIQLQLDGRELPEQLEALQALPCDLVVDHIGRFTEPIGTEHPAFQALLRLVEGGRTWAKLSAPYASSHEGPPAYGDVGVLATALAAAAPERMLWATNWPHPEQAADAKPDEAMLLDTLLHWVEDEATRRRILVDNPAQLYGF